MRTHLILPTILGLMSAGSVAFGQEPPMPGQPPAPQGQPAAPDKGAKKDDKRASRELDRTIQQLTERLGLTTDQQTQVRAILAKSEGVVQQAEADRDAAVRALLTAEQAPKFDAAMAERTARRDRGPRPADGGMPGMPGGAGEGRGAGRGGRGQPFDMEQAAERLSLTADQRSQFEQITREVLAGAGEAMRAARGQGAEGFRTALQTMTAELEQRLGEILTPEQKPKLQELLAERREQLRGRMGGGGAAGEPGAEGARRGGARTPEVRADQRMERVLADLALSEDERLVLEPKIREIVRLEADGTAAATAERDALEALLKAEATDAPTIRAKMDGLRKSRADQDAKRTELEKELRELVTIRQEAVLLLSRVLR